MSTRFITGVLSIGALIATLASAPAQAADRDDVGKFLGAAATLFILGKIIESETRDTRSKATVSTRRSGVVHKRPVVTPDRRTVAPDRRVVTPRSAVLPRACLIPVSQGSGTRYVMPKRCLDRNYRSARPLPGACKVTLRGARADRTAYSVRCMRARGYQVASR